MLIRTPEAEGQPATLAYFGIERTSSLWLVFGLFVVVVVAVARVRGLLALLGLVFAGVVSGRFMLPALLLGYSGLGVALVGVVGDHVRGALHAHGISVRTSAALAGTLVGVGVTRCLGLCAVDAARLTGVGDESGRAVARSPARSTSRTC